MKNHSQSPIPARFRLLGTLIALVATAGLLLADEPLKVEFRNSSSAAGNSFGIKVTPDGNTIIYVTEFLPTHSHIAGQHLFKSTFSNGNPVSERINLPNIHGAIQNIAASDSPESLELVIHSIDNSSSPPAQNLYYYDGATGSFEDLFSADQIAQPNGEITKIALSPDGMWISYWTTATNLSPDEVSENRGYNLIAINRADRSFNIITSSDQPLSLQSFIPAHPVFTGSSPLGMAFAHPQATDFVAPESIPFGTAPLLIYSEDFASRFILADLTSLHPDFESPWQLKIIDDFHFTGSSLYLLDRSNEGWRLIIYDMAPESDRSAVAVSDPQRIISPVVTPIMAATDGSVILAGQSVYQLNASRTGFSAANSIDFEGVLSLDGTRVIGVAEEVTMIDNSGQLEIIIRQHLVETGEETELARFEDQRSNPSPSFMIDPFFSGDGSVLFFHTAARITENDNNNEIDLFRFDIESRELSLISVNPNPGPSTHYGVTLNVPDGNILHYSDAVDASQQSLPESSLERSGDTVTDLSARNHRSRFYTKKAAEIPTP